MKKRDRNELKQGVLKRKEICIFGSQGINPPRKEKKKRRESSMRAKQPEDIREGRGNSGHENSYGTTVKESSPNAVGSKQCRAAAANKKRSEALVESGRKQPRRSAAACPVAANGPYQGKGGEGRSGDTPRNPPIPGFYCEHEKETRRTGRRRKKNCRKYKKKEHTGLFGIKPKRESKCQFGIRFPFKTGKK